MSTAKYIDGPDCVQTSLYGYDRNKNVQVNHLRGRRILVLRTEVTNGFKQTKWVVRRSGTSGGKPNFPSYAHFHHQYTGPKTGEPTSPTFSQPSNDGTFSPTMSWEPTIEVQQNVQRVFDKLAVVSPTRPTFSNSSPLSSSAHTVTKDITILQLNPAFTSKNMMSPSSSSLSPTDTSSSASSQILKDDEVDNRNNFSGDDCSQYLTVDDSRLELDEDLEENTATNKNHTCCDEIHCSVFLRNNCPDEQMERRIVLEWYDELIQWRHDVLKKKYERYGPPRCHPPPMSHTLIGASRSPRQNPFHRISDEHPFEVEAKEHNRQRFEARMCRNLIPHELPLPAPHEFIENAKRMEPHLFVEYCYQLTAAAYIDVGLNPPHRHPPIPPPLGPIPNPPSSESLYSSASDFSSDGEYSDDSEDTTKERLRQKEERHRKRELRLQQIFRRRATESMYNKINIPDDRLDYGS